MFEIELFQIADRIMAYLPPPHQLQHVPLKIEGVYNSMLLMSMSEQKNDLRKEFLKHLLKNRGSYTDVFKIQLVHIAERILVHLPLPQQLQGILHSYLVHKGW